MSLLLVGLPAVIGISILLVKTAQTAKTVPVRIRKH